MSEFYSPLYGIAAMGVITLVVGAFYGQICAKMVYRLGVARLGGLSILQTSFCPKCGKRLAFVDKIPVYSFLNLRGKCARCGEPIALRYLAFELVGMFLPFFLFWQENYSILILPNYIFIMALLTEGFICKDTGRFPVQTTLFLLLPQTLIWWFRQTGWEQGGAGLLLSVALGLVYSFLPGISFKAGAGYLLFAAVVGLCFGPAMVGLIYGVATALAYCSKAYFYLEHRPSFPAGAWLCAGAAFAVLFGDPTLEFIKAFIEFATR